MGVGGSAGSLAPLRELLAALPAGADLALVVVSHQAATGQSLLPEILANATALGVHEIEGEMPVRPGQVYVVPRGSTATLHDGVLALEPVGEPGRVPLPIDAFFRALARDRGHASAGVVLSGTGSDGTLGLAAIRSVSGLGLAQTPESAEFGGMPSSAIDAGAADFALPVAEMPPRLLGYARALRASDRGVESTRAASSDLDRVLALIRERGAHDFTAYKHDTLLRRIHRRMALHRIEELGDYLRYLEGNDGEIDALWRDWLIGVSGFFRDPEAFEALFRSALPALLAARSEERRLRIWVPGCATGEEAYSIAIMVREALAASGEDFDVQLFATDLDPSAIEVARTGRYPKAIAGAVGPERLEQFFVEEEQGYRVKKELRDRIVFAVQDVLHDPPFTRVDLVSCRNLLIYVLPSAQQALLAIFHYSLNPGGLLLLGSSEHLGESTELFATLDKRWRLFRRNDAVSAEPAFQWRPWRAPRGGEIPQPPPRTQGPKLDLGEALRAGLAERFGPPAVLVDLRGRVQQTHGRVAPYLELPPGRANLNVLDLAREGLRAPLAAALREAAQDGAPAVQKDLRLEASGRTHALRLAVERVEPRGLPSPMLLVSFEAGPGRRARRRAPDASPTGREPERAQLEDALQGAREDLQQTVSDLQAANEDLASANEEARSANEELQSSNEELQTSKEEAQSLNEELQTVNAELNEKLRTLEHANDDLLNLMSNIEIAILFLDEELRVKRFTPQTRAVARLIDSDVGRPLSDLAILVDYPGLLGDAERVLADLRPVEKQVSAPGGVWYVVRIRPYRTTRNAVEGLVVTFTDITDAKRAERQRAARVLADGILDTVHEPLLVLEPSLRVLRASRSFCEAFRLEPAESEGRPLAELGRGEWSDPRLRALLERALYDGEAFEGFELVHRVPGAEPRRVLVSGRPLSMPDEETPLLLVLGLGETGRPSPARGDTEDADA